MPNDPQRIRTHYAEQVLIGACRDLLAVMRRFPNATLAEIQHALGQALAADVDYQAALDADDPPANVDPLCAFPLVDGHICRNRDGQPIHEGQACWLTAAKSARQRWADFRAIYEPTVAR